MPDIGMTSKTNGKNSCMRDAFYGQLNAEIPPPSEKLHNWAIDGQKVWDCGEAAPLLLYSFPNTHF